MPQVSVIVPVYNAEAFLVRCINSILAQTMSDLEIILVDDGSSDISGEICDEFAAKFEAIQVIHQKNGGVSSARNTGLASARGEWIAFVDSDDYVLPNIYECMIDKQSQLCVSTFRYLYKNTENVLEIEDGSWETSEFLRKITSYKNTRIYLDSVCNKLYRNSIIIDNMVHFTENIKYGEDFTFNMRYIKYCKRLSSVNMPLYVYDCTNENSAVKKYYPEYDKYIAEMNLAMHEAFGTHDANTENANRYKNAFIADVVLYATCSLMGTTFTRQEKIKTLLRWYFSFPQGAIMAMAQQVPLYRRFCEALLAENLDEQHASIAYHCWQKSKIIENLKYISHTPGRMLLRLRERKET